VSALSRRARYTSAMNLLTAVAKVSRDYATWLRRLLLFTSVSENTGGNTRASIDCERNGTALNDDVSRRSNLPATLVTMISPYTARSAQREMPMRSPDFPRKWGKSSGNVDGN
jgi:hypothetical protein